jgi:hypothetical protein
VRKLTQGEPQSSDGDVASESVPKSKKQKKVIAVQDSEDEDYDQVDG